MTSMTPRQIELARNALGLPNRQKRSYRNRFMTVADHPEWMAMVAAGHALTDGADECGRAWFWLTLAGAKGALLRGESLCPEDFPDATIAQADGGAA